MTLPLVSIVIPVFNGEKYIDAAIRSVLDQTYPHIELIVLDDGSTDNTSEILKRYDGKLYWESQPNMGQSRTLNKGWKLAKGEILGYLSADDYLYPEAVAKLVDVIAANKDTICVFPDFELIDPNSRHIRNIHHKNFDYKNMIAKVDCPIGPGAIFTRDSYEKTGGWDATLRQMPDYNFWLILGLQGKIFHFSEVLAAFRVHEASQTYSRVDSERSQEPFRIINNFFSRDVPRDIRALEPRARSNAAIICAQLNIRAGRPGEAVHLLGSALKYSIREVFAARTLHVLVNAVFNRYMHKLLWSLRR